MALEYYRLTNLSNTIKLFGYASGSTSPGDFYQIYLQGLGDQVEVQSYIPPINIQIGINEAQFINDNFQPPLGYAWLWNDGNKVKYIKVNHNSTNNFSISPFISDTRIISFALIGAKDANRNFMYSPTSSQHVEDYYLANSTKKGDYSFLVVEQPPSSLAVSDLTAGQRNFNFESQGSYKWYATSSGNIDQPNPTSGITSSLAQGYFPKNIEDFGVNQLIRGWAGANYYKGDNLVPTDGNLIDYLNHFNTGSTERDHDQLIPYTVSMLPWFMNAPTSSFYISSSSFGVYEGQNRSIKIGPSFRNTSSKSPYGEAKYGDNIFEYGGSGTNDFISYYYKEDTNQILVYDPSNILNEPKNPSPLLYPSPEHTNILVGIGNPQTYITDEGHEIPIKNGDQLSVFRGYQPLGTGDSNAWNYNKYLHRPYKIYLLSTTGSNGNLSHITEAYVSFSSSLASERNDGVYQFGTFSENDLSLTASINLTASNSLPNPPSNYGTAEFGVDAYGGNGSNPPNQTWQTASLVLLLAPPNSSPGTPLVSSSLYIDDINLDNQISLDTIISSSYVQPGSSLRLIVNVNTGSNGFASTVNSSLIVTDYSMSIVGPTPDFPSVVPTYLDNILQVPDNCNPYEGNALNSAINSKVMEVDYSSNSLIPVNLDQILKNQAKRSEISNYHYNSPASIGLRYDGVKSTSKFYNIFSEEDEGTYGKTATIDVNKAYAGYFNRIYDTYPLLNEKTSLEIKYVIDEKGNAANPRVGEYTYYNLEGSLSEGENAKIAITDEDSENLYYLNGYKSIFKTGIKPYPILYSQAAARAYTSSIFVVGKEPLNNDPLTFNDYSFRAFESIDRPYVKNFGAEQLSPENIITGSGVNVTASYTSSEDANQYGGVGGDTRLPTSDYLGINGVGNNKSLSDDYTYKVNYTFETSKIYETKTKNGKSWSFKGSKWSFDCGDFHLYIKKNNQKRKINIDSIYADVVHLNPNTSTGTEIKSFDVMEHLNSIVHLENNNNLKIRMRGDSINHAMNVTGTNGTDIRDGGPAVKIRWRLKLQMDKTNNQIRQGDKIQTFVKGDMHHSKDGRNQQWWFYNYYGDFFGRQDTQIRLEGEKSLPSEAISSSYWGFVGDSFNEIEMLSVNGNQAYGSGFKQQFSVYGSGSYGNGSYNGYMSEDYAPADAENGFPQEGIKTSVGWRKSFTVNNQFSSGFEPEFLTFPMINDEWEVEVGDEIRFENNEKEVYKIIGVFPPTTQDAVNGESIGRLKLILNRDIPPTINLDFFLIRRYKHDEGNLILDFPKPYGVPLSPQTATGVIFPEFTVEELTTNPDEILKNLLEQKLIN
jgi:hypothetical protein